MQGLLVTELRCRDAERAPVWNALTVEDHILVYGRGHGNNSTFTGDSEMMIFNTANCDILRGRVVYLLSCYTANKLGPAIIAAGGIAYGGYNIAWTWVTYDTNRDPYIDWYAEGFYRSSNEFPIALIQGGTVAEARVRCIAEYNRWIGIWETERRNDGYAAETIKWLINDRDGLTVLGDTNATIVAPGTPTIMVVDVVPERVDLGQTFEFSGRLLEKETGTPLEGKIINLRVDGEKVATTTTGGGGEWSFSVSIEKLGGHRLYAEFVGDNIYAPGYTIECRVGVGFTEMVVTVKPPSSVNPGETFQFSGILRSDATGQGVPNKPINLWQSGAKVLTTTTADDGSWSFAVGIPIGRYTLYAEFSGDSEYIGSPTSEYMVAAGELPFFGYIGPHNRVDNYVPYREGWGYIVGIAFKCPEDGTAESISFYTRNPLEGRILKVKCAIYDAESKKLLAVSEEKELQYGDWNWETFPLPTKPKIIAGREYLLAIWGATSYSIAGFKPGDKYDQLQTIFVLYDGFPDPWATLEADKSGTKAKCYCSYTLGPPPPKHILGINSSPMIGVPVKVDGRTVGYTPTSSEETEGEHTVEVPGEIS